MNSSYTATLPNDLIRDLRLYVPKGNISKFIADATRKEIELKKRELALEFQEANRDEERNKEIELWDNL